jgi:hypothetical protein
VREIYRRWEKDLQCLDEDAWEFLKKEASPYLMHPDRGGRGWQQLFDILNQAHAYNYLKGLEATHIRFIPRAGKQSSRTPDLEGILQSGRMLCEVKTINISQREAHARKHSTVREIQYRLDDGFLGKLRSDIREAKSQLEAYDPASKAQHFVYINVCFDDFLGEYKEEYFRQIDEFLAGWPTPGVALVFHNDRTPAYKPLKMKNARVVNAN